MHEENRQIVITNFSRFVILEEKAKLIGFEAQLKAGKSEKKNKKRLLLLVL